MDITRRQILRKSVAAGGLLGLFASRGALSQVCEETPPQQEGPFYPEKDLNRDNDLTQMGQLPQAKGEVIVMRGEVTDESCRPISGALVEIWQACASGRYNHSGDKNPLELDPYFQYWGRIRSDENGRYEFRTIFPGHYPIGGGIFRPPHIHVKAHAAGFFSLTTQLYFDPKSYEDSALADLVDKLNKYENVDQRLIVHFQVGADGNKAGLFNIALEKHR